MFINRDLVEKDLHVNRRAVRPRSLDPIYIVAYYIIWCQTSFDVPWLIWQPWRRLWVWTAVSGDPDLRLVHHPGAPVLFHLCWLHLPHHRMHQLLHQHEKLPWGLGVVKLTITIQVTLNWQVIFIHLQIRKGGSQTHRDENMELILFLVHPWS